jgi:hypothetical protein
VFADPAAHALCADVARATAVWGAGWTAVAVCLSLLINSSDMADLRRWAAVDVRVSSGLIWIHHRDAVVTVAPLADDGSVLDLDEEDVVENLDHIRQAQIVDVACNGTPAADRRAH